MAYRNKGTKFSPAMDSEFRMKILFALEEEDEAINIDQIKARDFTLVGLSTQKMSRYLNQLVENGSVIKSKSKSGRMVYKAVSVMEDQGYDMEEVVV